MSFQTLVWIIYDVITLVVLLSITFIIAPKTDSEILFAIPLAMAGLIFIFGALFCFGANDAKYLTITNLEEWQVKPYKLKIEKYEKKIEHQKKHMSVNDIEEYNIIILENTK